MWCIQWTLFSHHNATCWANKLGMQIFSLKLSSDLEVEFEFNALSYIKGPLGQISDLIIRHTQRCKANVIITAGKIWTNHLSVWETFEAKSTVILLSITSNWFSKGLKLEKINCSVLFSNFGALQVTPCQWLSRWDRSFVAMLACLHVISEQTM